MNNNDYKDSEVTLMIGDCLERMKEIPDGSIDMILTDPPYGMDLSPQRQSGKFHGVKIKNDNNLDWCGDFFRQCFRLLKRDSAAFVFCSHHCVSEFISSAKKAGFTVKNLLVWDKKQFGMGGNWRPVHEMILVLTNGRFVTKSNSLKTIITFSKVHYSKSFHPTEKPIGLLEHLIFEPDYNAEIILDPFMGSGTTGLAAKNLSRKFIGIEMDEGYFDVSAKRIMGEE